MPDNENMNFEYPDGTQVEVTPKVLVRCLRETGSIMAAYAITSLHPEWTDKQVVKETNRILRETWDSTEWIAKVGHRMFEVAKEVKDEAGK